MIEPRFSLHIFYPFKLLINIIKSRFYFGRRVNILGNFRVSGCRSLLYLGRNVTINEGVSFTVRNSISIGDNVILSEYVSLYDCGLDANMIIASIHPEYVSRPIVLGNNVWVGAHSIILPGVTIGSNSVIGAGSVVTRDIPSRSVACGNPAKVLYKSDVNPINRPTPP